VIIHKKQHNIIKAIGTNGGLPFVEAAAFKHRDRLEEEVGGSFGVVEITQLREYIDPSATDEEGE
jgi:hypothetical protein